MHNNELTTNTPMLRWLQISLLALTMPCALPLSSQAQELHAVGERKVLTKAPLAYPQLARKMNLAGTVRLLVTVAPTGKAVTVEVLGGSPLLVQAAVESVSKFKWETAPKPTKEVLEIKFRPDTE